MDERKIVDVNIDRTKSFVSNHLKLQISPGGTFPSFSHIEISVNGTCNRRCEFCPRVDESRFPNIRTSLDFVVFSKMLEELAHDNFSGRLSFSGFCEPLLTPNIYEYIALARKTIPLVTIEMVSNGDALNEKKLRSLFESGLNNLRLSLYDGPHQVEKFSGMRSRVGLTDEQMILRVRYLGPDQQYGLTINNRGGTVFLKNNFVELSPLKSDLRQPCYYPFYKMLVDYNGDVLICSNDWHKKRVVGNVHESLLSEIWISPLFDEVRRSLSVGCRALEPCKTCDVDGRLSGADHFDAWTRYFEYDVKEDQ